MRILDSISKNIQIYTSESVSNKALDCYLEFFDASTNAGTKNGINPLDISVNEELKNAIPSTTETEQDPSLVISKDIRFISVTNSDNIEHTVNIVSVDASDNSSKTIFKAVLQVDWKVMFIFGKGWVIYDENGLKKNDVELEVSDINKTLIDEQVDVIYVGYAAPGSLDDASVWKIKKISTTNPTRIEWADGVTTYTKTWTERETYTYS